VTWGTFVASYFAARAPAERAALLERAVMRVWRVSRKVAAMFLSAVSNPDLGSIAAPWSTGIDWTRFIVIDSNVDRLLGLLGYGRMASYDARQEVICKLAGDVRLDEIKPGLRAYNPRWYSRRCTSS
jgi:hypothetical protein